MKHFFLIPLLLVCISLSGYAQQQTAEVPAKVHSFSLQDCINYAYEHQDSVKNAALDVKSAEYKVKETTGIGLPQVNGVASFTDYLKTPSVIFPSFTDGLYQILHDEGVKNGNGDTVQLRHSGSQKLSIYQPYNANLGLSVSQLLFDGSYLVGLKASKTYRELSQKSYTRSRIDARVNVTKAYYQVLVSDEQIKLLDADLKQLKQQVDQTAAENKQGFAEKIDVDRITVQYNNLSTTRENTVHLLILNYEMLKFQMGMPVNEELMLTDKLEDIHLDNLVDTGDTTFYHNRIEYSLGETSLKLNELTVQNQKAKFMPQLMLNGSTALGFQSSTFGSLLHYEYPSTYIGLSLNVPIFSGGQRINQLREAKIEVEKSRNDLENAKNGILLQAHAAYVTYANSLKSLDNQKENQKLAQEVLRVAKIKYQQGVGSSIEVTQAQTDMETADNQYIQALYNSLISKVDLDKAYGRIQ
ncbi:MAG TPA: TolC family protein [Mucilaginibacter sp.]|nr:TolC family protein [Mucilaginibacter sp.]